MCMSVLAAICIILSIRASPILIHSAGGYDCARHLIIFAFLLVLNLADSLGLTVLWLMQAR